MTTSRLSHDRQHELIEQTLHEIRGDTKWLRENQELMSSRLDRLETRMGGMEGRMDDLQTRLERVEEGLRNVHVMVASLAVALHPQMDTTRRTDAWAHLLKALEAASG